MINGPDRYRTVIEESKEHIKMLEKILRERNPSYKKDLAKHAIRYHKDLISYHEGKGD